MRLMHGVLKSLLSSDDIVDASSQLILNTTNLNMQGNAPSRIWDDWLLAYQRRQVFESLFDFGASPQLQAANLKNIPLKVRGGKFGSSYPTYLHLSDVVVEE